MIKAVIFDLDGTLANTLLDLSVAANLALEKQGFEPHAADEYRFFVGNGIPVMLKRASGGRAEGEILEQLKKDFFEYYNVHYCDKTDVYDGMRELVSDIKKQGLKTAVVTNKEDKVAKTIVEKLYGNQFSLICGNTEGMPAKPDPTLTLQVMKRLGVTPEECVFLGDSGVDIQTGVNSGAVPVGETWGFRDRNELSENGARYIIDAPAQLLGIIEELG